MEQIGISVNYQYTQSFRRQKKVEKKGNYYLIDSCPQPRTWKQLEDLRQADLTPRIQN